MTKHILIDYLISVDLKLKCFICNSANWNEKACEQIDKFNRNDDPPPKQKLFYKDYSDYFYELEEAYNQCYVLQ